MASEASALTDSTPTEQLRRIALCLQYDGSAYCGWQRQPRDPSVQETLEAALAQLDPGGPATVVAAGRTRWRSAE